MSKARLLLLLAVAGTMVDLSTAGDPLPVTRDVTVALVMEQTQFAIGDPILVDITYRNVGKETYFVQGDSLLASHDGFVVKDAEGRVVPNPFRSNEPMLIDGPFRRRRLEPGGEVVLRRFVNECVRFEAPGVYEVSARACVETGEQRQEKVFRCPVTTVKITVTPVDRHERIRQIGGLLAAYQAPRSEQAIRWYRKCLVGDGEEGTARLLVFYNDPSLIGFFVRLVEEKGWNSFGEEGLTGIPDRDAVLEALDKRLRRPQDHDIQHLLPVYLRLAVPTDKARSTDVWARRQKLRAKYKSIALGVLASDTAYRYPHLVPVLVDGENDTFLVDYLLRSNPSLDHLRRSEFAIKRANLREEHIPLLEPLLKIQRDWGITDAAITQLVKLAPERFLPILRKELEKPERERNFSPEVFRLLEKHDPGDGK